LVPVDLRQKIKPQPYGLKTHEMIRNDDRVWFIHTKEELLTPDKTKFRSISFAEEDRFVELDF